MNTEHSVIEIEERYCEIAAKRLAAPPVPVSTKPARAELFDIGPDGFGFVRLFDANGAEICVLPLKVPASPQVTSMTYKRKVIRTKRGTR